MYAVTVQGRALTFVVSGMLWNRSLVMMDLQTRSLWSHILGQAMQGPLKGASLEVIPSVLTTWRDWRRRHPDTTVLALPRSARAYEAAFHRKPRQFVLGLVVRGQAKAYAFDLLKRYPVLNDTIADLPVVVTFDSASTSAQAFRRKCRGRVLTFKGQGARRMTDRRTGSTWDAVEGRCLEGAFKGETLDPLPAIVSLRRAWRAFHPDSAYGKAPASPASGE